MTISLPNDLESRLRAAVDSGRFASVDDAMAEAARLLLGELDRGPQAQPSAEAGDPDADPLRGLWRDCADEMDEIVADAYRKRREEKWREFDL